MISWETPSIFIYIHNSITENEREIWPKVEEERVERGGVRVEMCSRSSLESYNFILLFLRGWKLFLSPHLQPCLLLFSIHFPFEREAWQQSKSVLEQEREKKENPITSSTCPLFWPQCLHDDSISKRTAAESTWFKRTWYYKNHGIISNKAYINTICLF